MGATWTTTTGTTTITSTISTSSHPDPLASLMRTVKSLQIQIDEVKRNQSDTEKSLQSQIDELKRNQSESRAKEAQLQEQVAWLKNSNSGKFKSKPDDEQNNASLANVTAAPESHQTMTMVVQDQLHAVSEEVRKVSADMQNLQTPSLRCTTRCFKRSPSR